MFSPCVEHGLGSEVDAAHVVAEDVNRIRKGNAKVLQDALEPYGFACGGCRASVFSCRASVFSFRVGQCDCRLLLVAPGDRSTAEGEYKLGCRTSVRFVACPVYICVSFKSNYRVRFVRYAVIHRGTDIP